MKQEQIGKLTNLSVTPFHEIKSNARNNEWQAEGRELGKLWIERSRLPCDCTFCRRERSGKTRRENYWVWVVGTACRGNPSGLVKHLRSRRAITRADRRILAELFEAHFTGEIDRALKAIGRPKKHWARSCARGALKFYSEWRDLNRRKGVNDWGHGDEMKDEACRVLIEIYGLKQPPKHLRDPVLNFEDVRALMERPCSRRA
jgi:hypothetical protein